MSVRGSRDSVAVRSYTVSSERRVAVASLPPTAPPGTCCKNPTGAPAGCSCRFETDRGREAQRETVRQDRRRITARERPASAGISSGTAVANHPGKRSNHDAHDVGTQVLRADDPWALSKPHHPPPTPDDDRDRLRRGHGRTPRPQHRDRGPTEGVARDRRVVRGQDHHGASVQAQG